MSFKNTGGNPRAHRIRVYFEGVTTIYEGMPVCYNYDTTTNWHGGSMAMTPGSDCGAVTATTTTADGSQNEGKYIRVELPADNNLTSFAGVVAHGSPGIGGTGASPIDIYVPNGAIVPCRCDVDTTAGTTVLAITVASTELGQPISGTSRPVGIAAETETGLDDATDITLVKLDPNMFVYQNLDGTHLHMGAGTSSLVLNEIRVESAQTSGSFCALYVRSKLSGEGSAASNSTAGGGIAAYIRSEISATNSASSQVGLHVHHVISAGTQTGDYHQTQRNKLTVDVSADISAVNEVLTPLTLETLVNAEDVAKTQYMIYMKANGTYKPDGIFLFHTAQSVNMTASDGGVSTHKIPIELQGTAGGIANGTYYLMVSDG